MGESSPINRFRGRVAMTSKNREEITIRLDNGGNIVCNNYGFKTGDEICILLDALNIRVVEILPAWIADLKVALGQDKYTQAILHKPKVIVDENEEMPSFTPEIEAYIKEVIENGSTNEDDFFVDLRQDSSVDPDQDLYEYGGDDQEWDSEFED